ncbi:hypothetical protein PIB30_097811, partial [Stylosanthes scabra]|nr:hypothetical protein [Stylosanthes scabra]
PMKKQEWNRTITSLGGARELESLNLQTQSGNTPIFIADTRMRETLTMRSKATCTSTAASKFISAWSTKQQSRR